MNWRKYLIVLLVIMGLMLVACGGNAAPANNDTAEEPAATVEEEPTAEPVEEEPTAEPTAEEMEEPAEEEEMDEEAEETEEESMEGEAEMASEEELDQAFQSFLADMEAYNTIGIEEVNTMLVEDPESLFLLDVREPSELEENGWIEGTVNIPLREVADQVEYLPSFDTTIVSYCGSGWRCTIALTALEAMGWEDVLGLKGGSFGGWVEAGYPIVEGEIPEPEALNAADPDPAIQAAMQEMLHNVPEGYGVIRPDGLNAELAENPDLILIDVRRAEELEENGVIEWENQIHIPLEEFVAMQDQWPEDMDAQIVTYCGSGHRSTIAMTILWSYGYSDVHSLRGGFRGWNEAGYPVVEYTAP
jgi:rhodanese-related sulfurtransferase